MNLADIKLVVGAGGYNNNPGWIHTEEETLSLLDETTWSAQFNKNSISAIVAEHVWEHLSFDEGVIAANICYKYLKSSGYIRCAVPDGFFPNEEYQNIVKVGGPGPKDHPASSHKFVHTYKTLSHMFNSAGFAVKLLEYCDEQGVFHYTDWSECDGVIFRSKKIDPRNKEELVFPSLILDAIKR
ncbi:class I SAM-dependent methyltransferase [Sutcliffiella cohnii]